MSETSLAQRVLNVESLGDSPEETAAALSQAHFTLTGQWHNANTIRRIAGRTRQYVRENGLWKDAGITEASIATMALLQIFDDRQTDFATNLNSWPVYQQLFERNALQRPESMKEITHALLIGSFSALSSIAFTAQAEDTYGAKHAHIIDVASGADKLQHGSFMYGSGLRPPFGDSTLQLVQTNQLLSTIVGPDKEPAKNDEAESAMTAELLDRVFDVLEPGGHLLMRECASGLGRKDKDSGYQNAHSRERIAKLWQDLPEALRAAGFRTIRLEEVQDILGVDYLFDPSRNFKNYPTETNPTSIAVYASK